MLTVATASIWGITVALGVAAAALVASDGRRLDEGRLLQQACVGLPSTRQAEDTLSTMRALSIGGSDPICTAIAGQPGSQPAPPESQPTRH